MKQNGFKSKCKNMPDFVDLFLEVLYIEALAKVPDKARLLRRPSSQ
jgi:nitrate reductase assembly molybdenum cofactor insertion protein NarJ